VQNEGPGTRPAPAVPTQLFSIGPTHLEPLCRQVAAETGVPAGRVRRILISAERHDAPRAAAVPLPEEAAAEPAPPQRSDAGPADGAPDRLRWYPIGTNGALRPPATSIVLP